MSISDIWFLVPDPAKTRLFATPPSGGSCWPASRRGAGSGGPGAPARPPRPDGSGRWVRAASARSSPRAGAGRAGGHGPASARRAGRGRSRGR